MIWGVEGVICLGHDNWVIYERKGVGELPGADVVMCKGLLCYDCGVGSGHLI